MTAATVVPTAKPESDGSSMTPTHSIPSIRGNRTLGECPCLVLNSDRFKPNALTCTSVQPERTFGRGTSTTRKTSGGPGCSTIAAFIGVLMPLGLLGGFDWERLGFSPQDRLKRKPLPSGRLRGHAKRLGAPCQVPTRRTNERSSLRMQ